MNLPLFTLALKIGQICTFASLGVHLSASFLPIDIHLRQELQSCAKETGWSGLLFLVFSWLFGVQTGTYIECTKWMSTFALFYIVVFLALIFGGALLSRKQLSDAQQVCRQMKKSALWYGILLFALAAVLG